MNTPPIIPQDPATPKAAPEIESLIRRCDAAEAVCHILLGHIQREKAGLVAFQVAALGNAQEGTAHE
jgi:hypothetical protein